MARKHLKRMPVVDRYGKLMGIVSRTDLIGVFVRSDSSLHEELVRDIFTEILLIPARPRNWSPSTMARSP